MASPLMVHIKLHRTRNWSVRLMPDPSGEEVLHFCVPCDENGLQLRGRRNDTIIAPDGSNVTVVGWTLKATPTFKCGKKLYCLLIKLHKDIYNRLKAKGIINGAEKKASHGIMGDIEPWPYE